jgi:hypothetical protein
MQWLKSGRSITSKQSIDDIGCTRLADVILRLRNDYNMPILTIMIPVKTRNNRTVDVAKYVLADEEN